MSRINSKVQRSGVSILYKHVEICIQISCSVLASYEIPRHISTYFVLTFPYIVLLEMSFSCNILWHGTSKYWSSISSTLYNSRSVLLSRSSPFPNYELVYGILLCNLRREWTSTLSDIQKCLLSLMKWVINCLSRCDK